MSAGNAIGHKLALQAYLWYNGINKILLPERSWSYLRREHNLLGGYAMTTLPPHAQDGNTSPKICLECRKNFTPSKYKPHAKFCSASCRQSGNAKRSAERRGEIQRGRGNGNTYTKYMGKHMHRVIAEQKIGRLLCADEVVHHINGNKKDNRPENLAVVSRAKHGKIHSTKYAPICIVDGCNGQHRWKGYCEKHRCQIRRHGRIVSI